MFQRFRRRRLNKHLRALVRETQVSVNDFIYPLFIRSGEEIKTEEIGRASCGKEC